MEQFTKELVDDLANKLLIGLSEEENQMVLEEFDEIERNMNLILKIKDIEKVEPLTHPFTISEFTLRKDDEIEELSQEEVLQNAEQKNLTSVIVPKVVSE
ncbi:MAG: Asp-tRNA(Asn)/Glu-tRNA(Gln) amidotransferase subunit GatC [Bacilli bacterium]|jgi:aspartyl/glutamyl-tRNA(Asn/Gln) amidotransferase C subunit|nr:Asp-tRNA(Asn)/Glu-tRNA(Gln) amidotransferase subunit GatC [Bacilli bacterium]